MEVFDRFWADVIRVWDTGILGASLGAIIVGLLILLVFILARGLFTRFLLGSLRRLASRTTTNLDDMFIEALERPVRFAFVVVGISIAVQVIGLEPRTLEWVGVLVRSLIAFTIFWTLFNIVEPLSFLISRLLARLGVSESAKETLRGFFIRLLKFVIFALGAAAVLQEWGFNVAAVLGGLGLVGMAVALAAKDVVANLFSGAMIFLNHMFEKGNWIKTPSFEGVVEDVGLWTTKVRQFDKALIVVENRYLTNEPITNYSRMTNRRIYWQIGVEYRTTREQLGRIVTEIRDFIQNDEAYETDPEKVSTFVTIDAFADSSINIMLYCFTKTTDWGEWLDVKQALALKVMEIVERNGTGFAFPSTSLYIEHWPLGQPEAFPAATQSEPNPL